MNPSPQRLPIQVLEQIDELCADFEKQWQLGEEPNIESFLPQVAPGLEQDVLLTELVALEIDYLRRRGQAPQASQYYARFPNAKALIDEAFGQSAKQHLAS